MNERVPSGITLGGYLIDTLKQMAENGTVVDLILRTAPISENDEEVTMKETRGVRVIVVGEDHIVVGPIRPVVSSFILLEEILMVRLSEARPIDYADDEFVSLQGSEKPLDVDYEEESTYLIPDGKVHLVDVSDFDESIADTPIVVIMMVKSSSSTSKIERTMEELAAEFDEEALFVKVHADSRIKTEFGVERLPAVVILSDDEIFSQIEGVAGIKKYRCDIQDAVDEMEEED